MLDAKTKKYIKCLGLEHLYWHTFKDIPSDEIEFVLLVTCWAGEHFGLTLGKVWPDPSGMAYMEPDDLGWLGPVQDVVAWTPIFFSGVTNAQN